MLRLIMVSKKQCLNLNELKLNTPNLLKLCKRSDLTSMQLSSSKIEMIPCIMREQSHLLDGGKNVLAHSSVNRPDPSLSKGLLGVLRDELALSQQHLLCSDHFGEIGKKKLLHHSIPTWSPTVVLTGP